MDEREGGWASLAAVPGPAPVADAAPIGRLSCDGETFELRPDQSGGTHYTWVSGPNPGYGFTVSPAIDDPRQHEAHVRGFLSMIDPETGYIAGD